MSPRCDPVDEESEVRGASGRAWEQWSNVWMRVNPTGSTAERSNDPLQPITATLGASTMKKKVE
jgi:hypothetical protein